MSLYSNSAATALRLLKKYGRPMPLKRVTKTYDPIEGSVTNDVATTQSITAVVLPLTARTSAAANLPDNLIEALRKGRLRKLIVAAQGLTFAPDLLDIVTFDGFAHLIQGNSPLDPGGVPLIYTMIVERAGLKPTVIHPTAFSTGFSNGFN